jgi:hypothetical protein
LPVWLAYTTSQSAGAPAALRFWYSARQMAAHSSQ